MEERLSERIARVSCSSNKEFVLDALAQGIRADGRGCDDCRPCVITPAAHGAGCQVEVQFGRTRVLAAVTSCIVEPYPDKPNKGIVTFSVKLDRCTAMHCTHDNCFTFGPAALFHLSKMMGRTLFWSLCCSAPLSRVKPSMWRLFAFTQANACGDSRYPHTFSNAAVALS